MNITENYITTLFENGEITYLEKEILLFLKRNWSERERLIKLGILAFYAEKVRGEEV
jgi:hypothetical protein